MACQKTPAGRGDAEAHPYAGKEGIQVDLQTPEEKRSSRSSSPRPMFSGTTSASAFREGGITSSQEAPPSPVFLRNSHGHSASVPVPPSGANGLGEHWTAILEPLDSRAEDEGNQVDITDSSPATSTPTIISPRKPTFLRRERWKAVQKARRKGMSLRAIERELGIHRATIKKYIDAEGPPTRQSRVASSTSSSDTITSSSDTIEA